MVKWRVDRIKRYAKARGWENPHQLAIGAGLAYPVARRLLTDDGPIERLDVSTVEALCRAFECEPMDLLEWKVGL